MFGKEQPLLIGIGGRVVAIDPATGTEIWRAKLKGSDTVTLTTAGNQVFAGTSGELFCLNGSDGTVIWHNKLKGLGVDIIAFSSSDASSIAAAALSKKRQAAAVAAT